MSQTKEKTLDSNGQIYDLDDPTDVKKLLNSPTKNSEAIRQITYKYKEDFAVGLVVPNKHPASVSYLSDVKDYNDESADIKQQIKLSRKLYVWEGVVGTVIDLLCDFAASEAKVSNIKNKKGRDIVKFFLKEVNRNSNNITTGVSALSQLVAFCYFIDGNVLLYNKVSKVKYGKNSSDVAKIPMLFIPIDPLIVDIPKASVNFGNKVVRIDLSKFLGKDKFGGSRGKSSRKINKDIPLRIRRSITNKEEYIDLTDEEIYHIKRRGTTFGAWGVPYLSRVFSAIASKRRLRALDDNTTDGMINSITIFKVGDKDNPATWDKGRIQKLTNLLANPSPSLSLVWAYDIDVLYIGPKGEVLNFNDKYDQVNYDIVTALGVPSALLTGQGEKAGDVWVSLLVLMEKIEAQRNEFKEALRSIINRTLEDNNILGEEPIVRMVVSRLRKEDVKNQILNLYDRGLLSIETSVEETGYDFDAETERRKREKANKTAELFVRPNIPFSPNPDKPDKPDEPDKVDETDFDEDKNALENTKAVLSNVSKDLKLARVKFSDLYKQHGIGYASCWYADRFDRISTRLGKYGQNVKINCKILKLASIGYNQSTVLSVIGKIEKELAFAIYSYFADINR